MTEKRLSLGINVSILLILTIFGVLLSLPLRLLLNTNYDAQSKEGKENKEDTVRLSNEARDRETFRSLIEYRKLKQCRRHRFEDRVRSIFYCDFDENCDYTIVLAIDAEKEEEAKDSLEVLDEETRREEKKRGSKVEQGRKENRKDDTVDVDVNNNNNIDDNDDDDDDEPRESKEIVVAGYILVTMLLVSAIAALVEVLRIRFSKDKNKDSSSRGNVASRKSSTIDLPIQRRFFPREPMKSQRSFELQGVHRSSLRLLSERPSSFIRRSSFPTQLANNKRSVSSASGTPNIRMSRRQSVESDEEIGVLITALHHRTRLIRRH